MLKRRWTILMVHFINWQIRHLTSKAYQRRLTRLIRLGSIMWEDMAIRAQALDEKMKSEPGMDPKTGIVQ